ncbi:MAG: universal stress protein [marine benthic group bacterium]|nr:universal stress protein [Gemmatimonadota bacterium]
MLNIDRLVLATDFSKCSDHALDHAVYLADEHGADLHVLHVIAFNPDNPHDPSQHVRDPEDLYTRLAEAARDRIADLLEMRGNRAVGVVRSLRRGKAPAPEILGYAEDEDVDLIVMGTHGWRGPERTGVGSVAEEVIRMAPAPVLAVREPRQAAATALFREVLVPIDLSAHSRIAAASAGEVAALYGARLALLHVLEESRLPALYNRLVPAEVAVDIPPAELARLNIGLLLEEVVGRESETDVEVLVGDPVSVITRQVRSRSVDLVVVASHGEGAIESLLMGSVAGGVVSNAACSVLVVKPFGKILRSELPPVESLLDSEGPAWSASGRVGSAGRQLAESTSR